MFKLDHSLHFEQFNQSMERARQIGNDYYPKSNYHAELFLLFLCKAGLANLRDVLFVGNPIYDDLPKEQARIEVLKRLPQVAKIDGDMVKPTERELATGVAAT